MARDRVDALGERVRRLLVVTDHLREQHAEVRGRLRALETASDGPDDRSASTHARPASPDSEADVPSLSAGRPTAERRPPDEASDEEVAAAIPPVEEDGGDGTADEERDDDILVA